MSQGFLLFAHNNQRINYGLMAVWSAMRIRQWLNKPVSIITDDDTITSLRNLNINLSVFDKIITSDSETEQVKRYQDDLLQFKNLDRSNAWELTPYDETIIIDTDIVIQSTALNLLWDSEHDLVVCKNAKNVFGHRYEEFEYLSHRSSAFYWATQFYFKKSEQAKVFFDTCKWIKKNYWWHAQLNDFDSRLLRNDYIWSIAINLLGEAPTIPWTLLYSMDADAVYQLATDSITLTHGTTKVCKVRGKDVHVMNKDHLQNCIKQELGIQ